jgi:integrase
VSTEKIRLAEARTRFIDRQEDLGRAPATIRAYNNLLRRLVRDLGDIQMVNISNRHVEEWIYGLRRAHRTDQHGRKSNEGIGPSTFNQTVSNLRVFFGWAQGQGYMRHNPTVNLAMISIPKKPRQRPSPAVLLQMLEVTPFPRDRAYIAIALNTGMRQNEILRIQVRDVNLDGGFISVVIRKTGEVDEQPISADLDGELRRWFLAYQEDIGRSLAHDDFLIPATDAPLIETRYKGQLKHGPRRLVPSRPAGRMEKVVQAAMEALGLPTYYEGTHTLRRAVGRAFFDAASQDIGDVAALRETASLLHHSNLHTTERYLGMDAEKSRRDRRIKGKRFLTALVAAENVVPLRAVANQPSHESGRAGTDS